MPALRCEICKSGDMKKQDGLFVCQNCGTKYTLEEAQKLLEKVELIKDDAAEKPSASTRRAKEENDKLEKLLVLARRARDENNSENAEKYYGLALQEDPNSWEASYFQVYYQAMQCKIMNISSAAYSVANNINGTVALIAALPDDDERKKALDTVVVYSSAIAAMLATAAYNHYSAHSTVDGVFDECAQRIVAAGSIFNQLAEAIRSQLAGNKEALVTVLKTWNAYIAKYGRFYKKEYRESQVESNTNEIIEHDASYTAPIVDGGDSGGCYIATAVYGSYDCPQVWTLRRYRDDVLAETWYGRAFIHAYYAISPTIVKWFGKKQWFNQAWKKRLDAMIARLRAQGVSDRPYQDKPW